MYQWRPSGTGEAGMMDLRSDIPENFGDREAADKVLCDVLGQWLEDGKSPATMLNAMADLINEILEEVATPLH